MASTFSFDSAEEDWDLNTLYLLNSQLESYLKMLPGGGVDMTLSELQEMAARQQQQIESQQQILVAKEQRLKYLKQQEQKQQQLASENDRLRKLRDKVEAQEMKLKKLRALRGQVEQQKASNGNLNYELESIKALFNEKEKELAMAVAKVEEMTRQLEEIRSGRVKASTNTQSPAALAELEKLKKELMIRNKLNENQSNKMASNRELLAKRKDELARMDNRIHELQMRLKKKRSTNAEMAEQNKNHMNKTNQNSKVINRPPPNIAAIEPFVQEPPNNSGGFGKKDPKYQSLPPSSKFMYPEKGNRQRETNNNNVNYNSNNSKQYDPDKSEEYTIPLVVSIDSNNKPMQNGLPSPKQSPVGDRHEDLDFPYCPDSNKYEKLAKIGQGTFGEVFKARDRKNKQVVAMKKVLMENEKEGFPITALREIKILQLLKNENVVNLIEICRTKATPYNRYKSTFYLIFEFCEHDLAGLLSNANVKFNLGEIKKVMQQLLNGLYYIHTNKILHRDMKAANILITKQGVLKMADFGLARALSHITKYTNRVVTLWYRPPELLLGERNYGPPIDIWGAGCILAEMWTRSPIMQGKTEQHQLQLISQLCGSIKPEVWPGCDKLELYSKLEIPDGHKRKVKERLKPYVKDQYALDLLDRLLCLDPARRIDSDTALNHDFFWEEPPPQDLSRMLSQHSTSMFEYLAPPRKLQYRPAVPQQPRPAPNMDQHFERVF